jgi:hypothetical protein
MGVRETELDTSKLVISNLEIMETDIAYLFSNSTISSILPTD